MSLKITNPRYNENGTIDCDWDHPAHGLIRFTASPDDVEPHGREIYQRLIDGEYGQVSEYEPPEDEETDEAE